MIDYVALTIAKHMPDHPAPGAKMSGGDSPKWDADMEYWLESSLIIYDNPCYICSDMYFSVIGEIESGDT